MASGPDTRDGNTSEQGSREGPRTSGIKPLRGAHQRTLYDDSDANIPTGEEDGELSLRILRSLAHYIEQRHGMDALERVARKVNLYAPELIHGSRWVPLDQFEAFLSEARDLLGSDEELREAAAHEFHRTQYGPVRWLVGAASPWAGYQRAAQMVRSVARICRVHVWREGRRGVFRYVAERPESRLMCIVRQAQIRQTPTLWGLPPAHITERKCVAWGDDCCEYEFPLFETRSWLPAFIGLAIGLIVALVVHLGGLHTLWLWIAAPALCALLADYWELTRTSEALSQELRNGFREMAADEAEARRELLCFHQRQREWTSQLEEQVAERTAAIHRVVERIRTLQEARAGTLRGFSHDLRNPLTVLRCSVSCLRERSEMLGPDAVILDDMTSALDHMRRMFDDLMENAMADARDLRLDPQPMAVGPIVERLQRRLKALVHGRDIRPNTYCTRDAPEQIVIDELVFDRVIDNLLTNAAKYTDRGSISVEVTGRRGFLTLRVSDTGRGIDDQDIRRIFRPNASPKRSRAPESYGVGLSVVVQLMDAVGGELEVASHVGEGTTFWAHFPVEAKPPRKEPISSNEDPVGRVVKFRKIAR